MIIIETCPKCGHDLHDIVLTTYSPIPKKECWNCGWSWTGEREEVVKVPFGGNSWSDNKAINGYLDNFTVLNTTVYEDNTIPTLDFEQTVGVIGFVQSACENCSNNPKNGGSGVCHCTLGQQLIY